MNLYVSMHYVPPLVCVFPPPVCVFAPLDVFPPLVCVFPPPFVLPVYVPNLLVPRRPVHVLLPVVRIVLELFWQLGQRPVRSASPVEPVPVPVALR